MNKLKEHQLKHFVNKYHGRKTTQVSPWFDTEAEAVEYMASLKRLNPDRSYGLGACYV